VNVLRTIASAICIVLGALCIATWAASWAALDAIREGTVIEDVTARAIASQGAQDALVENGTEQVLLALEEAGIDSTTPGIEGTTAALIKALVSSEAFNNLVHAQTKSIREQMVVALDSDGPGAITITINLSDEVNMRLEQVPVIGSSIPEIAVPGIPVQVMDDATAAKARTVWDALHFAKQWFGWLGLALVAIGILVSNRKRWFFAKLALAVGVISAAVWLVMTLLEPQTLAERIPGGGVADALIVELVHQVKGTVATVMGYVALGAMIVALLLFILASRGTKGGRP